MPVLFAEQSHEMFGEQRYVTNPVAERGEVNFDDAESVIEVSPECAGCERFGYVPVGRRNNAHIGWNILVAAETSDCF